MTRLSILDRGPDENEAPDAVPGGPVPSFLSPQLGDDAIGTGQTEKATRKGLGSGSQIVGQYMPEKETDDRHGAFEDAEDRPRFAVAASRPHRKRRCQPTHRNCPGLLTGQPRAERALWRTELGLGALIMSGFTAHFVVAMKQRLGDEASDMGSVRRVQHAPALPAGAVTSPASRNLARCWLAAVAVMRARAANDVTSIS